MNAVSVNHSLIGDIFALTKPKITLMALLVACAGLLHANVAIYNWNTWLALLGISALVSGSSALNMYIEREQDRKMLRTKDRPLPAGRINAWWAIAVGFFCALCATILLYASSNLLTLWLGIASLIVYVFCYTPLKQKTWLALIVGSFPGAMPVMLGYTALANAVDEKAIALFSWAFLWQIPHFLAISLFREQEYTAAGFPVLSARSSQSCAKIVLLLSSWLLVASTLGLYLSGIISFFNFVCCAALGVGFLVVCHRGAFSSDTHSWARRAFRASLIYQGLLFLALIIGALV